MDINARKVALICFPHRGGVTQFSNSLNYSEGSRALRLQEKKDNGLRSF